MTEGRRHSPQALKISTVSFLPCFLPPASCLLVTTA